MNDSLAALGKNYRGTSGLLASGMCVALAAGLAPLAWNDPWAPMFVGAIICATAAGAYLLKRPRQALYIAIFMALIPMGLRVEPIYMIISNLAIVIALIGWLIQWLLRRERIRWNVTWLLVAAYIALGVVTLLWAPDFIEGRRKFVAYTTMFTLFFLIIHQVRTLRSVDGLMTSLRCIGWIIIAGGVFEIVSGGYQPGERLSVFEINQNQLVMILIVLVPSFIWPVLRSSGIRSRFHVLASAIFILCVFVFIALSGSRGGALSLAVLMVGSLLSRQVRPWALLGAVMMVGLIAITPSVLETLNQRFEEEEGGSFGSRDLLWEASLLLIQDHPWTGVGLGGGPIELPKYIAVVTGETFLNKQPTFPSHNPLLEVGADTGIFGMMLYGAMLLSVLGQAIRKVPFERSAPVFGFYRPLILIVAAAYSLSWIKSGGVENHPTFFLLLGLLMIPNLVQEPARRERTMDQIS
jgi:O-antigen ligase